MRRDEKIGRMKKGRRNREEEEAGIEGGWRTGREQGEEEGRWRRDER